MRQLLLRRRLLIPALAFLVLAAAVGLWLWNEKRPKRVRREHADTVAKEYEFLTERIVAKHPWATHWLTRKEAEQDLDQLEWYLERRYSYLKMKGVDYRAALDTIRSSLGDGIPTGALALQIHKFLMLFGDGHTVVRSLRDCFIPVGYAPFLVTESAGRLVAFKVDRSAFLDADHHYLESMDGIPVERWLEAARETVARGSPQYVRQRSVRNLRYVQYLRRELGLKESDAVQVELASEDEKSRRTLELKLAIKFPRYGIGAARASEVLPGNVGYLRMPAIMYHTAEFQADLMAIMDRLKETRALIIDVRENGGGSRAPLLTLFPFFAGPDDPPRIANVAAYRLHEGDRRDKKEGYLEDRYVFPLTSRRWSGAERAVLESFAKTFRPEWSPPEDEFSAWHYLVLGRSEDTRYYHYDRPVIILMSTTNYSACDIFLGAFKGWKNVTLMGTPSGGGSGRYRTYRLHNSLIAVNLSSMASFRPNGKLYDGNGIQPDIIAEPIATDFIGETDPVLDAALERLR